MYSRSHQQYAAWYCLCRHTISSQIYLLSPDAEAKAAEMRHTLIKGQQQSQQLKALTLSRRGKMLV